MTQMRSILCESALLAAAVIMQMCFGNNDPQNSKETAARAPENKNEKAAERPDAKPVKGDDAKLPTLSKNTADQSTDTKRSADEEAILVTAEAFVKAYNALDTKAIAAQFTSDAEYIDEQGYVFHGREAIEEVFVACLEANPGAQMEMNVLSIRLISPGVAVEDGTTTVTSKNTTAGPIDTNYTAVHVKVDGKWLTASVREQAPKDRRQHRAQLEQLSWLQGDWVDEGEDTLVISSCKPTQGGNFLIREFKIHIAGQETMRGEQRIGWDPLTGKLKSWVFDSDGGYSEGFWRRDDDRWILKSFGVSTDGQPASSTTIYTLVNENSMTWQTVDHEEAGVTYPDSDVVTIVRRAPPPKAEEDNLRSELK